MRTLWLGTHLLLAGVGFRVFDMLLLKQHLDRPLRVAAWLAAIFLLVLLARAVARRRGSPGPAWLRQRWAGLEAPELALLVFLLVLLFAFHWGYMRAASDGREYFVQVRSLVKDLDLDFANENAAFGVRGTADRYAFGGPLLWVPFFVAADAWLAVRNLLGDELPRNGFLNPYQRAVGLGTLLYGFAGLLLIFRLLGRYFSRALSATTTIALTSGSFLAWYLVSDNSMVHGISLFATALFVTVWHDSRDGRTRKQWALLGLTAGLMTMVRWQNALFVVFAAADVAADWWRVRRGRRRASRILGHHAAFAVAGLLAFLPQLLFWKLVRGSWLAVPSAAHGAEWAGVPLADVLFSPDRGLFSWTPLLLLATLGLFLFARRQPRFGWLLIAALAAQVYVNATVEWSGHGFGARRFANCAIAFAVGLAALLEWLRRRPLVAPAVLVAGLVVLNLFFMLGMHGAELPPSGAIPLADVVGTALRHLGNPFALPMNAWVAWRHGADLGLYERLGAQTFNNLAIDLGEPGDERFLLGGWAQREAGGGISFRWSSGPESSMVAALKTASEYRLELRCAPFRFPGAPRQVIEVWVNGEPAGRVALEDGLREYAVDIPATLLRPGVNRLDFRYAYTRSPAGLGLSTDPRELAVQFDRLMLRRVS